MVREGDETRHRSSPATSTEACFQCLAAHNVLNVQAAIAMLPPWPLLTATFFCMPFLLNYKSFRKISARDPKWAWSIVKVKALKVILLIIKQAYIFLADLCLLYFAKGEVSPKLSFSNMFYASTQQVFVEYDFSSKTHPFLAI